MREAVADSGFVAICATRRAGCLGLPVEVSASGKFSVSAEDGRRDQRSRPVRLSRAVTEVVKAALERSKRVWSTA
jgi:hypothetical protein